MSKALILSLLAFAMLGMQACFESSSSGQAASPPVCDAQGNNCQSTTTKSSWGFFF